MEDTIRAVSTTTSSWAALKGGPSSIPAASRSQTISPQDEKIKIPHYGGYEHFERTTEFDEGASAQHVIFRWTMRTKMAE